MNPAHLDHDALADLAEGLLDDAHAASANAHLDSCAECRERSAEIAEVSRILADVPVPPMPAEVAERIEAAIAAEAMATAKVASISHHRRVRERGRKWHLRVISAAAATLVVVGAGAFLGVELMRGSLLGSDDHTATTQPPPADRSRTAPFTVVRSGTAYRSATLGDQVTAVVPKSRSLPAADSVSERLQGCVQGITRGAKPVLVDAATYESREATIVVVPTDSATWRVVVAGPSCSADDPAVVEETTIPARTP